jgi:hypothetical protein
MKLDVGQKKRQVEVSSLQITTLEGGKKANQLFCRSAVKFRLVW